MSKICKWSDNYVSFIFTKINQNDQGCVQCLHCTVVIANAASRPSKLKNHCDKKHPQRKSAKRVSQNDRKDRYPILDFFEKKNLLFNAAIRSSFEGHPLQVRHKQDWGRRFIILLPQTAALPESDAVSGVIKPASSFVIQNRQTSCSMWCPMYKARC